MSEKTMSKTRTGGSILTKIFGAVTAMICIAVIMATWLDGTRIRDMIIAGAGVEFAVLLYIALIFGFVCAVFAMLTQD